MLPVVIHVSDFVQVEVLVYLTAKNGFSWGFATYVSVTMKALWYKPKTNSFDFGSACKSHPDEPYDPYVYVSSFTLH